MTTTAIASAVASFGRGLALNVVIFTGRKSFHHKRIISHQRPASFFLRSFSSQAPSQDTPERLFAEELNVIYDSKCNVCKLEIEFLKKRDLRLNGADNQHPRLRFTDLESGTYDESDPKNGGITYAAGMKSMHAVTKSGEIIQGVPVFEKMYEQVQLGWLFYALHKVPGLQTVADFFYNIFARYRTIITRGSQVDGLIEAFEQKKKLEGQKKQSMQLQECSEEGSCAVKGNVKV